MKVRSSALILSVMFILVMWTPKISMAIDRIVVSDNSLCSGVITDSTTQQCYTSVQAAVTDALAAQSSDTIEIWPGTYPLNATINKSIPIHGVEAARTFLTGGGNTIIALTGVTNLMSISNLTFINAAIGIQITNGTPDITNNIFEVGSSSTAIQVSDNTSTPSIKNNTFYQNAATISSSSQNLTIVNNIFSNNSNAISANVPPSGIQNNLFSGNTNIGPNIVFTDSSDPLWLGNLSNQNLQNSDPLFVKATNRDFHLQSGSPAIGKGRLADGQNSINGTSPPDIGAYGGPGADTRPYPVSDLSGTENTATSVNLTWTANLAYQIAGYNVYYNIDQSGPPYSNGPIDALKVTSYTLNVTIPVAPALSAPTNLATAPVSSGTLQVTWDAVSGATGYEISHKKVTDTSFITSTVPAATNPSAILSGLTDSVPGEPPVLYDISVHAFYVPSAYVAVKSYYASNTTSKEALDFSNQAVIAVGSSSTGADASIHDAFAERIVPTPGLQNKGCFIATAAYGYYSAPQVQALREFRDRYLVTNAPGRAFVQWYYQHGPMAARFINEHPEYKPIVRAALMPAVAGAMFMTRTSVLMKMIMLLSACMAIVFLLLQRRVRKII
jgi:hypothetical protein